jgi:hypothetical protein
MTTNVMLSKCFDMYFDHIVEFAMIGLFVGGICGAIGLSQHIIFI